MYTTHFFLYRSDYKCMKSLKHMQKAYCCCKAELSVQIKLIKRFQSTSYKRQWKYWFLFCFRELDIICYISLTSTRYYSFILYKINATDTTRILNLQESKLTFCRKTASQVFFFSLLKLKTFPYPISIFKTLKHAFPNSKNQTKAPKVNLTVTHSLIHNITYFVLKHKSKL